MNNSGRSPGRFFRISGGLWAQDLHAPLGHGAAHYDGLPGGRFPPIPVGGRIHLRSSEFSVLVGFVFFSALG